MMLFDRNRTLNFAHGKRLVSNVLEFGAIVILSVVTVMSLLFEYAIDRGWTKTNPAEGVKRIKRNKKLARANRPWSEAECRTVLERVPPQLKIAIALAMCAGFRKADVLTVTTAAVRDGMISVTTSTAVKPTGTESGMYLIYVPNRM